MCACNQDQLSRYSNPQLQGSVVEKDQKYIK